MKNVFQKVFEPYGYSALPRILHSTNEVANHVRKKEPVLLVFPISRGKDTHISHVTSFDGNLFYTNDEMFSFRPPEMDATLQNSADLFHNEFNTFVMAKSPPFPGGS